jgi:HD superfamily phosphodiesterase
MYSNNATATLQELELLKDMVRTTTGKRTAQQRHAFMQA